jgi:uncharacterized protein (UPF0371 family)
LYCIEQSFGLWKSGQAVLLRHLEDRIRDLYEKAVSATEPDDFNQIIAELRFALREHAEQVRKLAVATAPGISSSEKRKPAA